MCCVHVYMQVCKCVCLSVHVHLCVCVWVCIHSFVCTCMRVCACMCAHIHTCMLPHSIHISHVGPSCPFGSPCHRCGGVPMLRSFPAFQGKVSQKWQQGGHTCCAHPVGDRNVLLSWLLGTTLLPLPPFLCCRPLVLGSPAVTLQFYPMMRSPVCKRPWAPRPVRPACPPASKDFRSLGNVPAQ